MSYPRKRVSGNILKRQGFVLTGIMVQDEKNAVKLSLSNSSNKLAVSILLPKFVSPWSWRAGADPVHVTA